MEVSRVLRRSNLRGSVSLSGDWGITGHVPALT